MASTGGSWQVGGAEGGWWDEERGDFLLGRLSEDLAGLVVDLGCGRGENVDRFVDAGAAFVVGCDSEPYPQWHPRPGRSAFVVADVARVPFRPGVARLVTCLDVIEHFDDDAVPLGAARRLVRADGRLAVTVPGHPGLWSPFDDRVGHHRRYTRPTLERSLRTAGFTTDGSTTHFFAWLAPAAWAVRHRDRSEADAAGGGRLERPIRAAVHALSSAERALLRRARLPVGSSIFALSRPVAGAARADADAEPRSAGGRAIDALRTRARPLREAVRPPGGRWDRGLAPPGCRPLGDGPRACVICGWSGPAFEPPLGHPEGDRCPRCGSIGRDRFLVHALATCVPWRPGLRLLETSPRLGRTYRRAMGRWYRYTASDLDEREHRAALRLDLQQMDEVRDAAFDVVCSSHVLEHVPDTDRAIDELHRILAPGGHLVLQVPLLQAVTAPPVAPEFHGDDTPVHWRFGFDLTDRLRRHGFEVTLGVTDELQTLARSGDGWADPASPEFDVPGLLAGATAAIDDLHAIADESAAARSGFRPPYAHAVWICRS